MANAPVSLVLHFQKVKILHQFRSLLRQGVTSIVIFVKLQSSAVYKWDKLPETHMVGMTNLSTCIPSCWPNATAYLLIKQVYKIINLLITSHWTGFPGQPSWCFLSQGHERPLQSKPQASLVAQSSLVIYPSYLQRVGLCWPHTVRQASLRRHLCHSHLHISGGCCGSTEISPVTKSLPWALPDLQKGSSHSWSTRLPSLVVWNQVDGSTWWLGQKCYQKMA